MSDNPIPTIGRIVHYKLSSSDAEQINRRRGHARTNLGKHQLDADGSQIHVGNDVKEGDVFPMIVTRAWGSDASSAVNGQVFLDGNDLFWATSVTAGDQPHQFTWPTRA